MCVCACERSRECEWPIAHWGIASVHLLACLFFFSDACCATTAVKRDWGAKCIAMWFFFISGCSFFCMRSVVRRRVIATINNINVMCVCVRGLSQ